MKWKFPAVTVEVDEYNIYSTFFDGHFNRLWFPGIIEEPEYVSIAYFIGYNNPRNYAIEHDLTHHWFAEKLKWPYSFSLYEASIDYKMGDPMPLLHSWEEHVVNSLQRYVKTGELDEQGILVSLFPDLEEVAKKLTNLWRNPSENRPSQ